MDGQELHQTSFASDKRKPGESRGRKAAGLPQTTRGSVMAAGLPNCGDYEGNNIMQDRTIQDRMTTRTTFRAGRAWRTPAALTGLFLAGLSLTGLVQAAGAAPAAPKTDTAITAALAASAKTGWIGVIVRTPAPLTAAQEAQMTALGADIVRRLPIIGSVAVRVPQRSLAKLAALPFASHLSLDGFVKKTDEFTVGSSEANLAFSASSTAAAGDNEEDDNNSGPYLLTGKGVTVAVVDSGETTSL